MCARLGRRSWTILSRTTERRRRDNEYFVGSLSCALSTGYSSLYFTLAYPSLQHLNQFKHRNLIRESLSFQVRRVRFWRRVRSVGVFLLHSMFCGFRSLEVVVNLLECLQLLL